MNSEAVEKIKLHKMLDKLSEDRLESVRNYVNSLIEKDTTPTERTSLKGIWKGSGWENIDFEKELKQARKEMSESILSKKL